MEISTKTISKKLPGSDPREKTVDELLAHEKTSELLLSTFGFSRV